MDACEDSILQLRTLRMGFNSTMGANCMKLLGILIENRGVRSLSLEACKLSTEEIKTLDASLGGANLQFLDVSSNILQGDGMLSLGELIRSHAVSRLVALGQNLNGELLSNFGKGIGDAKLELLDVSNNEGIGVDGMHSLGKIAESSKLKTLGIRGSRIEADDGKAFRESVGSHKLETLQVSREVSYERNKHLTSYAPPEIEAAMEILPVVSKYIEFNGYEFNIVERRTLQHKLDKFQCREPKIVYGGKRLHGSNKWFGVRMMQPRQGEDKGVSEEPEESNDEDLKASKTAAADPGYTLTVSKIVGLSGDSVRVGGCSLVFPKGAFKEDSEIIAATRIRRQESSKNLMSVSSILNCTSSKKLEKKAKAKLSVWVATDDPSIMLKIRRKREGNGQQWTVIKTTALCRVQNGCVEVECEEFSWYDVVMDLMYDLLGRVRFYATGSLYYDEAGNFSFGLYIQNQTARMECLEEFENDANSILIPGIIDNFAIRDGDIVKFRLTCETEDYEFDREEMRFNINREFLNGRRYHYYRTLMRPKPQPGEEIVFVREIYCQDEMLDDGVTKCVVWPKRQANQHLNMHFDGNVLIDQMRAGVVFAGGEGNYAQINQDPDRGE